jgi:hypothetical protein
MGEYQLDESDISSMNDAEQYLNNIRTIVLAQDSSDPIAIEQGKLAAE